MKAEIARARKQLEYSRYYEEARRFGGIVSRHFQQEQRREFVVVTGGGPGMFEALTLVQTKKLEPIPVVLVGSAFWRRAVDFAFLVEQGMISESDVSLFSIVDTADEAVALLHDFYHGAPPG